MVDIVKGIGISMLAILVLLVVGSMIMTSHIVVDEYAIYNTNLVASDNSLSKLVIDKIRVAEAVNTTEGLTTDNGSMIGMSTSNVSAGNYSVYDQGDAQEIWNKIASISAEEGVDPLLVAAMCEQESDFGRNRSVSSAGAVGLMQFLPETWKGEHMEGDPNNDDDAIRGACKYIKTIIGVIGTDNPADVGAAYNQGPYGYKEHGNKPSTGESKKYYAMVGERYAAYANGSRPIGYPDH